MSLKDNLARFNDEVMTKGYNIFKEGNLIDGDYNSFTLKIQGVKTSFLIRPSIYCRILEILSSFSNFIFGRTSRR